MHPDILNLARIGFALGGLAALGLLVYLWRGARGGLPAWAMAVATILSAVWAAVGFAFAVDPGPALWTAWRWLDPLRAVAWVAFLLVLWRTPGPASPSPRVDGRAMAWTGLGLVMAVGLAGFIPTPAPLDTPPPLTGSSLGLMASLGLAIAGLVCVEQLLRRTPGRQRWGVWPLAIALGGLFVFDLYLYADAMLLGRIDAFAWSVHGMVLACAMPLLGVAATRNQRWTKPLALSHGAAFHSTVLLATAAYLLIVAALGYLVRFFGGAWGPALQIVLFVAALMVMGVLLTLGRVRSKLRVLIGKNFFKQRYDYREEWLRFTRLLAARDDTADIYVRCIQALADLVECTAGSVWIRRPDGHRQVAQWNTPTVLAVEPLTGELTAFMARTGWVIDLEEYRAQPDRYERVPLPTWLSDLNGAWMLVPLIAADGLTGFVVLMSPRVRIDVDWEVLDLLKAAGSEVAVLLRQVEVNQALAESEKFAAVSRLSTFVVHDLKNLVAQLSLMLKNAERHGDNPEFREDMLETVRHVVDRMNSILAQARLSTKPVQNPHGVDVAAIARRVCRLKESQRPGLVCRADKPALAVAHGDRLEHVLAHVVQNALDATDVGGIVRVSVLPSDDHVTVEVEDNGIGMSPEFVQQRLFRPFETTKESGMGIGVYESQQYVASLGGRMDIESAQGLGTCVRITLRAAVPGGI